jgi:hypothetical protein
VSYAGSLILKTFVSAQLCLQSVLHCLVVRNIAIVLIASGPGCECHGLLTTVQNVRSHSGLLNKN